MRQAGRYLPEYRALRARARDFLDFCYTPELAVEATLQPLHRYDLDAAIVFSDILVVADALGVGVSFVEGVGPRLEPVRTGRDLARLRRRGVGEHLAPVYETVRRVEARLGAATPLIGFAGAPWTVAAYMVEGEASKEFVAPRHFAWRDPPAFAALLDRLVRTTIDHLRAQLDAGADLVQLFDSWAGILPEPEFRRWCIEPACRIVAALAESHPGAPVIAFPRGAGALYRQFVDAVPVAGLGLDTSVPLGWARRELGAVCLQGNLDPVVLLTGGPALCAEARRIVATLAGHPFVFNLGHGVLPETDPAQVAALIEIVRAAASVEAGGTDGD
jgi:uroporphyrinogen decarboxylase